MAERLRFSHSEYWLHANMYRNFIRIYSISSSIFVLSHCRSIARQAFSPDMKDLPIYTLLHAQYRVLDHTGQLPFSIVFGLYRRSGEDADPRPLILDTRQSALDVSYALARGLLKLYVGDSDLKEETALAIFQLNQTGNSGAYLTLPSQVNRKGYWGNAIVTYQYQVEPNSELASIFKPGVDYQVKFASDDLGVKWYSYGNGDHLLRGAGDPNRTTEKTKLVSRPSTGRRSFTVVPNLPWPPKLCTTLDLERTEDSPKGSNNSVLLRISVINSGKEPITVQTRGRQRFLIHFFPEERPDARPRIIDSSKPGALHNIRIIDRAAGTVISEPPPLGPSGPGGVINERPKLDTLVTIKSSTPLVRVVDISKQVKGLPDGIYEIYLKSRGMWWCIGERGEFVEAKDDRVPHRLWNRMIPRVMLETDDCVVIHIESGQVLAN